MAPLALLLVEPDSMMRRTVASVARSMGLGDIREASSLDAAQALLHARAFDGVVVALADDGGGLDLLRDIRQGTFETARDCPAIALVGHCDPGRVQALGALRVQRVILKPFKVKTVLDSIAQLGRAPRPHAAASRASHAEKAISAPIPARA
jgi:CheY-like chemotaxis protein